MSIEAALAGAAEWRRKVRAGEIDHPSVRKRREYEDRRLKNGIFELELSEKVKSLREELAQLEHHKAFSLLSIKLTNRSILRPDEIISAAKPIDDCAGVYFLIKSGEIIYIGQSTCVLRRVQDHRHQEFDSVSFIPCDLNMLDKIESLYIHLLRPKNNGKLPDKSMNSPIKLSELFA